MLHQQRQEQQIFISIQFSPQEFPDWSMQFLSSSQECAPWLGFHLLRLKMVDITRLRRNTYTCREVNVREHKCCFSLGDKGVRYPL